MKYLLAFLFALFLCLAAGADEVAVVEGAVVDGYTFSGGYYWWQGVAYSRTLEWWQERQQVTAYDYYHRPYYTYQYVWRSRPIYTRVLIAPAKSGYDAAVKQMLDIAAGQQRAELARRKEAQTHAQILELAVLLGLQGNLHLPTSPAYVPGVGLQGFARGLLPSQLQVGSHGVTGQTVYGSDYRSQVDLYGDTNLALLYQAASKSTERAQVLGGEAHRALMELATLEGEHRARAAEWLAKAAALNALKSESRARITERVTVFGSAPGAATPAPTYMPKVGSGSGDPPAGYAEIAQQLVQDCVKCHYGEKVSGGFDVRDTFKRREQVMARLLHTDPGKLMPRNDAGVGERLGAEKLLQWIKILSY